jgi:3-deoxy-7-phosphoheptulonate synthase
VKHQAAVAKRLLLSAEYILGNGVEQDVLCVRVGRSFAELTRNLRDGAAIPVVHSRSRLSIIADPCHGKGLRTKVRPTAGAAITAGDEGVICEANPNPEMALSHGAQLLCPRQFEELVQQDTVLSEAIGRRPMRLPLRV